MGIPISKATKPTSLMSKQDYIRNDENAPANANNAAKDKKMLIIDVKAQVHISADIDRQLQKEKSEDSSRVKILLLGGADAGKSTIVKQMRILHMNGFDAEEMRNFQKVLRSNLFQIFHEMALGVQECILTIDDSEKCVRAFIEQHPNYSSLPDNAHYYLPKLSALLLPGYEPTAEDILHLRVPTTSVSEINFTFEKSTIRLIDVGGQRTYRKKWIHCFDGVAAVLFVASMAAYDQTLEGVDSSVIKPVHHNDLLSAEPDTELNSENRMRDSAHLLAEMLRSKFLVSAAFILFLNKRDLFLKKLPLRPLREYLPKYKGSSDKEAEEFVKAFFLKKKSKKDVGRAIYPHFTCATDTHNVEFVFAAACAIALKENLNSSGIE
ncbi:hypothetical protein PRIPAC_78839 [Pristionchus pacificus]|uniref:ADP ribosylation factor n=1 Tax=Pristionchus pacificus TaxID=54126 RepID=A0A2A6CKD4_PRIPA|nr:hypothetical protein PRIPAC_78839 [Pristionchus pacificus]|eukprot:PDM78566.1 ADP ribosylation factor [Pristionchus pacificus]